MALKRAREPSPNDFVEVDDSNSFLSTEIALSFDHIFEQIFQSLNPNELLNCRLVCHRWLNFAHKPLQNQIKLHFRKNEKTEKNGYRREDVPCKRLSELTILLKKGQSLLDLEDNGHAPILFPCNRFELNEVMPSNEDVKQFLNTNGQNILELNLDTFINAYDDEYVLMDVIGNLLLNQAPNIRSLNLKVDAIKHGQWKNKDKDPCDDFVETTDPEYEEIRQKALDLLQSKSKLSPSLKVLHLSGDGYAKILEFIIRISPNLEEIKLDDHYESWLEIHMNLLFPENRLLLLKEFIFYFNPEYLSDNSNFEIIEKFSFGNFRLRYFEIHLSSYESVFVVKPAERIQEYPDCQPRFADMTNRIFKGSWDTLEKLSLTDVTSFKGIKFPEVMPKLKEIKIVESMESTEEADDANWTVFPVGENFQKQFPKLSSIHLRKCTDPDNVIMDFSSFLKRLNFGADPLSTSVKRVVLSSGRVSKGPSELESPLISPIIQEWFPNASICSE